MMSRLLVITMVFAMFVTGFHQDAAAATKKINVSEAELAAGKQLQFVDMPYHGAYSPIKTYKGKTIQFSQMQNFDFSPDGRYVFIAAPCYTGSVMHTMVMRCPKPANMGPKAETTAEDFLILEGYGHGEVIAITQDDPGKKVYNIWIGCDPGKEKKGHARSIARVTYAIGSNGKGTVTKTVKIKGFKQANVKKGKAAYFKDKAAPQWVHAAVDTKSNQLVFRLRFEKGYGCIFLSYDYRKLNAALDKVKNNGTYNIKKAAKWQRARVMYNYSIQSFDVEGRNIYFTDGSMGGKATVGVLSYKFQNNKKLTDQKKTAKKLSRSYNITPLVTINGVKYDKNKLEIEGIKVKDGTDDFYISFVSKGAGLRDSFQIYQITK